MANIKVIHIEPNCEPTADDVKNIYESVNNLDFDWCDKSPIEVYVSAADNTGHSATAQMRLDVLAENNYGYFGFSMI